MPAMDYTVLPTVNAALNATAASLLVAGYMMIRRRRIAAHRACMVAALCCSALFLTSYLIYHAKVGSVGFQGTGPVRSVYFATLISHTVLAAAVPLLAIVTVWRALRERFERHVAIARWTLPIWLYVSVSGVAVYWMLYRMEF